VVGGVLVVANGAAALFRFLVLRAWMFRMETAVGSAESVGAVGAPLGLMNERETG
jgi:hypothetical protein